MRVYIRSSIARERNLLNSRDCCYADADVVCVSVELGRLPLVKTAAKMARGLCYENKDRLLAGMIIAGWDPVEGGSVYEIPLGGTMMKQKFALGGSGSTYM